MAEISTFTTNNMDNLISGNYPVETIAGTLITGQNLTRGSVLGKITASGKLTLCDSTAVDGSEAPYGILMGSVDATAADMDCVVYLTGSFNETQLVFGGTDTIATHRDALRVLGIFARSQSGQ